MPHPSPFVDQYLVARAQACASGESVHDLSGLLSLYYGLAEMQEAGLPTHGRLTDIERQLRAFCLQHEASKMATAV